MACFDGPSTETAAAVRVLAIRRIQEVRRGHSSSSSARSSPPVHRVVVAAVAVGGDRGDRRAGRARGEDRRDHARLQRVAGLVPARGRREGRHLRGRSASTSKLKYFADYIGSLDAMAAGKLDAQHPDAQRHDGGGRGRLQAGDRRGQRQLGRQRRRSSATSRSPRSTDLKGKTIAAEEGVVDHFLLLQGLATGRASPQDDIDFRGVLTADAAAALRRRPVRLRRRVRTVHARRRSSVRARTWCSARRTSPAPSPTTSWCRRTW